MVTAVLQHTAAVPPLSKGSNPRSETREEKKEEAHQTRLRRSTSPRSLIGIKNVHPLLAFREEHRERAAKAKTAKERAAEAEAERVKQRAAEAEAEQERQRAAEAEAEKAKEMAAEAEAAAAAAALFEDTAESSQSPTCSKLRGTEEDLRGAEDTMDLEMDEELDRAMEAAAAEGKGVVAVGGAAVDPSDRLQEAIERAVDLILDTETEPECEAVGGQDSLLTALGAHGVAAMVAFPLKSADEKGSFSPCGEGGESAAKTQQAASGAEAGQHVVALTTQELVVVHIDSTHSKVTLLNRMGPANIEFVYLLFGAAVREGGEQPAVGARRADLCLQTDEGYQRIEFLSNDDRGAFLEGLVDWHEAATEEWEEEPKELEMDMVSEGALDEALATAAAALTRKAAMAADKSRRRKRRLLLTGLLGLSTAWAPFFPDVFSPPSSPTSAMLPPSTGSVASLEQDHGQRRLLSVMATGEPSSGETVTVVSRSGHVHEEKWSREQTPIGGETAAAAAAADAAPSPHSFVPKVEEVPQLQENLFSYLQMKTRRSAWVMQPRLQLGEEEEEGKGGSKGGGDRRQQQQQHTNGFFSSMAHKLKSSPAVG